ncbi:MAG: hypothetical protein AXA67_06240 [Methylothermaceae bacteria B42]|nr:MAG: hypothetical protein AXA67_06240 [Methylothermaceae bacteria B42]HHJ39863.1 hypothetical protein [Methylothermaceae bacterium]
MVLAGCSTYKDRVAPVPLPASQPQSVQVDGVSIAAYAYLDPGRAEDLLGFDVRGSGLIPVRLVLDNQSSSSVQIVPQQTFLVDNQDQAWPLLTSDQAYRRIKGEVEIGETFASTGKKAVLLGAVGAVTGFAIGILSGGDVAKSIGKGAAVGASIGAIIGGGERYQALDSEIRRDLRRRSLRNHVIPPGALAYGYLFFPGTKAEAKSAKFLRLGLKIGGQLKVVTVPLPSR